MTAARIEYQTILDASGNPAFVVLPYNRFLELYDKKTDTTIPNKVVSAVVDGQSPVRAWREYQKLTQKEVASRMGISQAAFAQMESADSKLRKQTRQRIAQALGITADQLDW